MSDGEVRLVRDGAVATILFDRPQARNAMTWRMYEGLAAACAELSSDNGVRVAVLRGVGGKAFIAGTDIAQFQEFTTAEQGVAYEAKMEAYLGALEALPMPTLAVVEGWAIGGGLAIAACCDLRIATAGSKFGVPIARTLGNCLSVANYARLVAALGSGARQAHVADGGKSVRRRRAGCRISDGRRRSRQRSMRASPKSANGSTATPRSPCVSPRKPYVACSRPAFRTATIWCAPATAATIFMPGVKAFVEKRTPQWSGR